MFELPITYEMRRRPAENPIAIEYNNKNTTIFFVKYELRRQIMITIGAHMCIFRLPKLCEAKCEREIDQFKSVFKHYLLLLFTYLITCQTRVNTLRYLP